MTHSPNPTAMSREAEAALTILEVSECGGFKSPKLPIGMAAVAVRWNLSGEETVEYVSESAVALLDAASRPRTALTVAAQTAPLAAADFEKGRRSGLQEAADIANFEARAWGHKEGSSARVAEANILLRIKEALARPIPEKPDASNDSGAVELRVAFERWIKGYGFPIHRHLSIYKNTHTAMCWNAWQASRKSAALARPVADEPAAPVEGEELREALEFYANPDNWVDVTHWEGDPEMGTPKAVPVDRSQDGSPCDCGDRARAALAAAPKANGVGTGGEGWQDRAEKAEAGLAESIAIIEFAIQIDDHYDRLEFLKAWSEGDTSEWPEFAPTPSQGNDEGAR